MIVARVVIGLLGLAITFATLGSAARTVVVPRGERLRIVIVTFSLLKPLFFAFGESTKARFAPVALLMLPIVWGTGVLLGLSATYWALGVEPIRDSLVLSGSSLTTLGFRTTEDLPTLVLEIFEGLIGLGLVALLISFLPTMYSTFSSRERAVTKLHQRASAPGGVGPAELLIRANAVRGLDDLTEMWVEWENWFIEIEETHTSYPMLVFFRSPVEERSWVVSAGIALDAAALFHSTIDRPAAPRAAMLIRTGTLALRQIADFFRFEHPADPAPDDPISVTREEFDAVYDRLAGAGVAVRPDRDQCWRDFAGWRVNYDTVLLRLAGFIDAPSAAWISDRSPVYGPATTTRRR